MWYVGGELYHHGIKGQHWGERRYQNPDGSYTEEGRRRYFGDKYGAEYGSKEARKKYNADVRAYARDRKEQMRLRNRLKNGESRSDVEKKLREKYGDIEYDSFEKSRKKATARGKMILAAAALTAASTAAIVAKKIGDKNQKIEDDATRDALAMTFGDERRIRKAGDAAYEQPKREELNASLHKMNSLLNNDKYKNTQIYKKNEKWFSNRETDLDNMYNRAYQNGRKHQSFRPSDASRWKNAKAGTTMLFDQNPHMTRNQHVKSATDPFYSLKTVTRSAPIRSQGQAMQYAPKSNSFTRSSNGLRRKYKPTW